MYRLIIVEDESEIRSGLCSCFPWEELGFEVVATFENGKQALDYILKEKVDAILSDVKMPVMSGIELARIICMYNFPIKIVFISGYQEFEFAQKAMKYGVRYYITKPAKYDEIIEIFSLIKKELDAQKADKSAILKEHIKESLPTLDNIDNVIDVIKNYIERNYKEATLETAAKLVYMNPYYLSRLFKQKTGKNFSDYLLEIRMKKAMELLKIPLYKTHEIGEMVGYKNPKNFTRAFKKYYGKPPSEFSSGSNNQ